MSTVPGSSSVRKAPLGRRTFVAIVLIGLSGFAWGGVARDETKAVMPDSLLPWVLLKGDDGSSSTVPLGNSPGRTPQR